MSSLGKFEDGFRKALADAGGTHSIEDLKWMLTTGRAYGAKRENAAVVVRTVVTPQKHILFFWLATGEMDAVCDLVEELCENVGHHFDEAVFIGRKGWQRTPLADQGWEPGMIQYTRKL